MTKSIVALLAASVLAGCVSLGAKPPRQLLTLSAVSTVPAGTTHTAVAGQAITVLIPTAAVAVLAPRIPVYQAGGAVAYVKDAAWVDTPVRLFQRLLSETVAARTGRVVLDQRQFTADPGLRLQGTLQMFGVDETLGEAIVIYDAIVARPAGLESRRFEARVKLAAIDATTVGPALNAASNKVAADVADWLK